jgi:antitoxin HigA-1
MIISLKKERPTLPVEILKNNFMLPAGLNQKQLAERLGLTRSFIKKIIWGERSITTDTAIRLSRLFGTTIEFWLKLQIAIDIWTIMKANEEEYMKIKPLSKYQFVNKNE